MGTERSYIRIVRRAEDHGGHIAVDANVIRDRRSSTSTPLVTHQNRRTDDQVSPYVLVVDDQQSIHDVLRFILKRRCTILSAQTGKQALEALEKTPGIELVFLDIKLPDMGGLDVLRVLKERWPAVPVTVVSESCEPDIEQQALDAGAFHFMRKSFDFDWMNELLSTALDGVAAFRENEGMFEAIDNLTRERDYLLQRVADLETLSAAGRSKH